jgi:hypothetical protein
LTSSIINYLRHHALAAAAFVCSILALAGSSYAAFTISGSQIRNHTINPSKLNPKFINGNVRAWAIVAPNGRVIAGAGRPRVTLGISNPGDYEIRWGVGVRRCVSDTTIDDYISPPTERVAVPGNPSAPFTAGYAVAATSGTHNSSAIQTFDQGGRPTPLGFDVAVIC